tara:strand:+ start:1445 stop:2194 length:750 start_codon:yes stop_codon:yes gene_type:complete
MLVDVHCHLNSEEFDKNRDEVIKRAEKLNMTIVDSGTTLKENKKSLELSKKYKIVESSLGLYPLHAIKLNEKQLNEELNFIKKNKNKIISIGEIGLDKNYEGHNIKKQIKSFEKVLSLAEKINKPVVIHSRKAEKECIDILETFKTKNIMHCFTGNFKLVKRIQDNNYFFSIPTNIVRLLHFQKIVEQTSTSQLLTETDSPYLSPYKEKRNEPSFTVETIKQISKIKNLEQEEVKKLIYMNFQKVFLKK